MSDQITKKDVQEVVSKSTNDVLEVLQTFMYQVDERFKQVESRFDSFDKRFDDLTTIY